MEKKKEKKRERNQHSSATDLGAAQFGMRLQSFYFAFDRDANQFGAAAMFYRCGVPGGALEMGTCSAASLFGPARCCLRNVSARRFSILFLYSFRSLGARHIDPLRIFLPWNIEPAASVRQLTF